MPEGPYEVQKNCHGQEGGPILGRLHAVERYRLLSGFEVSVLGPQGPLALLSYTPQCSNPHHEAPLLVCVG